MKKIRFTDISVPVIRLTFKQRFWLAKTCNKIPPVAWVVKKIFFDGDDIQVLPMDKVVQKNSLIKSIDVDNHVPLVKSSPVPSDVLKLMIQKSRYRFIMNFCICRTANNCEKFPHELGCLFLGKGASRISPNVGRLASIDEAIEHIEKCGEAGLVHIIGRNKIDCLWLNAGKHDELLTICNCCDCCCLWKMAPYLPEQIGNSLMPMEGIELVYNPKFCTLCGACTREKCFVHAITMETDGINIDKVRCKKCGRCVDSCKYNGLTISMDSDTINRSIEHVEKLVDVKLI
ncbi:MAG: 4Fe-4S ferredoxin [Methanobacterium sp.]|nr:4Fe-4S ferredoxin [Methanobacterium sp.]